MTTHTTIWSSLARTMFFETLLERFGKHDEWETRYCPSDARREEFEEFLLVFAKLVGSEPTGPRVQFQWATEFKLPKTPAFLRYYVLNKAAAFNAGFISEIVVEKVLDSAA